MDNIPTNTIYKERQIFLSKIKSDPIFFLRHAKSFSGIMWRLLEAKLLIKLRGRHQGQKKRPHWLKSDKFQESAAIDFHALLKNIPERQLSLSNFAEFIIPNGHPTQSTDPEDYLFVYRWGQLMDDVLATRSDINSTRKLPASVHEWLSNPPPKKDFAWETYSTCERLANLITWISFIPMTERFNIIPITIDEFLRESIAWIFTHLEYYGKQTGNHIVNNARALIMGGTLLKNDIALQSGMLILKHMLPVLIQQDGFLRERSSHYQLIVLTWLLDIFCFARISNHFSASDMMFLQDTIKRMCNAASLFCNQQGDLQVFIGDISPDMTPIKTMQRLKICYPDDWPPHKIDILPMQDWHLITSQHNKVLLNCPQGNYPKQIPSHAHGDITSFVWIYDEQPIFIDTGRARYTKDPISSLQKSAVGHNVALVNNLAPLCESFVLNGHWWPTPYASAEIKVASGKDNITLEHNGFNRATPVKTHTRTIQLSVQDIEVRDYFNGVGKVSMTLLWHLHHTFTSFCADTLSISNGKIMLTIDISKNQTAPKIEFFYLNPKIGWYSSEYGLSKPNPVLVLQWFTDLPFQSNLKFRITTCVV